MDTIIDHQENRLSDERGNVTLLHFHQGMVVLIGADAIGLYRDAAALTDPLGNGVLGYEPIPPALAPSWQEESGYVETHTSGFVGLHNGAALFIRPDGIALYPSPNDALHNRNACWLIPFPPAITH